MFRRILPKEVSFFEYFEQHAALTIEACTAFLDLATGKVDIVTQAARIKEIEHQADDVTHRCSAELNKTFITPIDRTDILTMIKRLDDVLDSVDATTSRMALYELTEIRPEARELGEVLLKAVVELEKALKGLRSISKPAEIEQHLIEVHHLENEADIILRAALSRLFKEEKDAVLIMKWKEIFERLEKAADRSEEAANIIEKIVIEAS